MVDLCYFDECIMRVDLSSVATGWSCGPRFSAPAPSLASDHAEHRHVVVFQLSRRVACTQIVEEIVRQQPIIEAAELHVNPSAAGMKLLAALKDVGYAIGVDDEAADHIRRARG